MVLQYHVYILNIVLLHKIIAVNSLCILIPNKVAIESSLHCKKKYTNECQNLER